MDGTDWTNWVTILDSTNYSSYVTSIIENYYWADVKVSTTSNKRTTPSF
jgi:hypothetical protein